MHSSSKSTAATPKPPRERAKKGRRKLTKAEAEAKREALRIYYRNYRARNREKCRAIGRAYCHRHRDQIRAKMAEKRQDPKWRAKNQEYQDRYNAKDPEAIRRRKAAHFQRNKARYMRACKARVLANPEKYRRYFAAHYLLNKGRIRARGAKKYWKEQMLKDDTFFHMLMATEKVANAIKASVKPRRKARSGPKARR